jgi:hypothetical protein
MEVGVEVRSGRGSWSGDGATTFYQIGESESNLKNEGIARRWSVM